MDSCTCTKDKQMTCIVHPTTASLKARIAELEVELAAECEARQEDYHRSEDALVKLEAENAALEAKVVVLQEEVDAAWSIADMDTAEAERLEAENAALKERACWLENALKVIVNNAHAGTLRKHEVIATVNAALLDNPG